MTTLFDDFNRANSTTSLGANWTARNGVMGINANQAFPVTSTDVYNLATYVNPLTGNDFEITATAGTQTGTTSDEYLIAGGCNSTGEGTVLEVLQGQVAIYSISGWDFGATGILRGIYDAVSFVDTDWFTFKRVGNVYTASKNNILLTGVAWTDSTNIVPRDSSHRFAGIGAFRTGANYRRADDWTAVSVDAPPIRRNGQYNQSIKRASLY